MSENQTETPDRRPLKRRVLRRLNVRMCIDGEGIWLGSELLISGMTQSEAESMASELNHKITEWDAAKEAQNDPDEP